MKEGEIISSLSPQNRSILEDLALDPGYKELVGFRGAQTGKQKGQSELPHETENRGTRTGSSRADWQPGT